MKFLQELAAQIDPRAEFVSWHPMGGPDYAVGFFEAVALFNGDAALAQAVLCGSIQLHKMPAELRKSDRMADRIDWARREAAEADARADALLAELNIDISDLRSSGGSL